MAIQRSRLALLALLLCLAAPCHAQTWHADSSVRQFAWGPVNVLVRADTTRGLSLWAGTASVGYHGTPHKFHANFDPDTLPTWLNLAHAVVAYRQRVEGDSVPDLRTRLLYSADSSAILVLRERKASSWSDRAKLVFLDKDDKEPWSIAARASEANALFVALFAMAASSRLSAAPPTMAIRSGPNPLDARPVTQQPRLLKAGKMDIPLWARGRPAEVWMEFTIGADGVPEADSFTAIFFTDSVFADVAYQGLMRSRFKAGLLDGVPVRVRVSQRVTFSTN
jgi:hypothetical protein